MKKAVNLHAVTQGRSLNGLAEGLPHPIHLDIHTLKHEVLTATLETHRIIF